MEVAAANRGSLCNGSSSNTPAAAFPMATGSNAAKTKVESVSSSGDHSGGSGGGGGGDTGAGAELPAATTALAAAAAAAAQDDTAGALADAARTQASDRAATAAAVNEGADMSSGGAPCHAVVASALVTAQRSSGACAGSAQLNSEPTQSSGCAARAPRWWPPALGQGWPKEGVAEG